MIQKDQKVPILGLWFLDTDCSVGPEQVVCMRSDDWCGRGISIPLWYNCYDRAHDARRKAAGPSDADTTSAHWQKRDTQLHNNTSFPTMAAVSSFLSLKTSLAYAKLTLQHVNDVLLKEKEKEGKTDRKKEKGQTMWHNALGIWYNDSSNWGLSNVLCVRSWKGTLTAGRLS